MKPMTFLRLLAVAVVLLPIGCGQRVLVCYRITAIDPAPEAVQVVTYRRVIGPGPATVERTVRDAAVYAHPWRWRVGYWHWEVVERAKLEAEAAR